ncbi:MAG: hypothetical protein Q7Q73_09085 [Verrucomicrobiota bacterium JB024]|nr:hypothetical protein [Verrucomicrobiota bacterium JB024]
MKDSKIALLAILPALICSVIAGLVLSLGFQDVLGAPLTWTAISLSPFLFYLLILIVLFFVRDNSGNRAEKAAGTQKHVRGYEIFGFLAYCALVLVFAFTSLGDDARDPRLYLVTLPSNFIREIVGKETSWDIAERREREAERLRQVQYQQVKDFSQRLDTLGLTSDEEQDNP